MIFLPKKIGGESPLFFSYKKAIKLHKGLFDKVFYFNSGRNAISEIIKYENVSEVFIPEYYCYPVYIFLKQLNVIHIEKYSSKKDLLNKLENSKTNKKLIILLLFNGMNESLKDYNIIKQNNNSKLITLVDAAMSPFISGVKIKYDYCLTNPRKFYRIPIGSFVFSDKSSKLENNYGFNVINTLNYILPKLLAKIFLKTRISIFEKFGLRINKYSEDNVPTKTDIFTLLLIKRFGIFDLSTDRINQYNLYYELLKPIKKYFYFKKKAEDNDCPFAFILQYKYRNKLNKFLNIYRIYPSYLWDVPYSLKEEVSYKTLIKSNEILLLPIGPQYSLRDIKHICYILLKFFE